ncbi:hypothetical protein [Actinomadura madurae]|uniref:hypothetical protein n=1 Tax=Actinomadura madurae TaxID=1993 RepID=UPI0020D228E5|nr:hypothetical protein [Actinomadura madurae]MCQ0004661.1 hypothetical protein [Actinomadura madurae]
MVGEPAAEPGRVAVDRVAEEQLVPDGEQFDPHRVPLSAVRTPQGLESTGADSRWKPDMRLMVR